MRMKIEDFIKYYQSHYSSELQDLDEINDEIEEWKYYRKKILDGTMTGFEYNSTKENFNGSDHKSLQHFIERETPNLGGYGAMVSGKMVLWIEGVGENSIWHNKKKDINGKFGDVILSTGQDREALLNEVIQYLKQLIKSYKFEDLITLLDDQNTLTKHYGPRSFLEKIITLNSWLECLDETEVDPNGNPLMYDYHKQLIFIYDFSNIENSELLEGKTNVLAELKNENNNLRKNKILTSKILEILNIASPSISDLVKIQRCLWELTESEDKSLILSDSKKNVIFYGAPGTSKTYAVKKSLEGVDNVVCKWVQFHPGFTYEDFIEGIKPTGIDSNGNLKLNVVNGCFKDFCIQAKNDQDREYYFIADEINRANLSAVFGETLSLIENSYRWDNSKKGKANVCLTPLSRVIQKLYEDAKAKNDKKEVEEVEKLIFDVDDSGNVVFGIPKNIHFIGMMNDVDKSIDTFDLALRRRFVWVRKGFDESVLRKWLWEVGVSDDNADIYIERCSNLNYFITGYDYNSKNNRPNESLGLGKSFEIGHGIFMNVEDEYISRKRIKNDGYSSLWFEHLEPTIREYLRSSISENDIEPNLKKAKKIFIGTQL